MKTKWNEESAFADGSGFKYYFCQAPQENQEEGQRMGLKHLYQICFAPSESRLWFWDTMRDESNAIHLTCNSWQEAEMFKAMLTKGTSHWMEAPTNPPPRTITDELADYKNTPDSAKDLMRRLTEKFIGLKCPNCGHGVPIEFQS